MIFICTPYLSFRLLEMHDLLMNFVQFLIQIIHDLYLLECKWNPGKSDRNREDPLSSLFHLSMAAGQEGSGGTQSPSQHLLLNGR